MGEITLETPDGDMPAFFAEPTGAARGGAVVIQEAFGLTPHIGNVVQRLADAGWVTIAPALFHRQGNPVFEYDGDFAKLGPIFQSLSAATVDADVDAAVAELDRRGFPVERTGITGFCMGGTVALVSATRLPFGAAVSWYGGGVTEGRFGYPSLVEAAPSLRAPWLGLYGDRDTGIPVEQVEQLRTAAATATVPTEVVRYPEAEHGFNCDDRAAHHPESAADGWQRMLTWFQNHIG